MIKVSYLELKEKIIEIFKAADVPHENASRVAELLVESNLSGHESHGVIRVRQYLNQIKAGLIDPKAMPTVEKDYPAYSKIQGNRAFGQIAATKAIEKAIANADISGISMVACVNMAHIGRLGDYVNLAAEKGMVGLAFCNGGGPNVAAYGGKDRVFGTNPLACSFPSENGVPFQIDFASASTAEGKLNVSRIKGEKIKVGKVLDNKGKLTDEPNDFYDGGSILPIGNNKGSALSLLLEMLGGVFTGAGCSAFDNYVDGNGILFVVFKPDLFRSLDEFNEDLEKLKEAVLRSSKSDGVNKLYLPGQKEIESKEKLIKDGIEIDDRSLDILNEAAGSVGVSFSFN